MCHGFLVHFAYIFIKLKRPISQRNLRLSDEITDKLQNCTVSCDKALYQTLHALPFFLGCFPTQPVSALTLWVAPPKVVLHLRMFHRPRLSGDCFVIYVQIYDI